MAKYMKTEDGYQEIETTVSPIVETKMDANNPVGTGSFSMGRKSGSVIGTNSHAEGFSTTAKGNYSHAECKDTTASGDSSHAEGHITTARGDCSHAEGFNTTASGHDSHAEGDNTTASGDSSHAEGFSTTAKGDYSHAEGSHTTASGMYSHAEGDNTTASGNSSHAEGFSTTASGMRSHAEGEYCKALGKNQHVQGKYNIESGTPTSIVDSDYAHIIGNGKDEATRSNAYTLTWSGIPWYQGRPQFGGTAMDNGSQTVMANGDKEIILASSTANSTKKFKITVDDSGAITATEVTT